MDNRNKHPQSMFGVTIAHYLCLGQKYGIYHILTTEKVIPKTMEGSITLLRHVIVIEPESEKLTHQLTYIHQDQ